MDLRELEKLSEAGLIDLFYGDETSVSSEGYVPYGWQFPDEDVAIWVEKGYKMNCVGLINRQNQCYWGTNVENIDAMFIRNFLDDLSFKIRKEAFVVLDNSPIHKAKLVQEMTQFWQDRGLFIFFLPAYSPHLNIAEILWRMMKGNWIVPEDYLEKDSLFYYVNRCLANFGTNLSIEFSRFNL